MPKQPKLVKQDADGIWLAAPLAAEKSGLSKPELARRALVGTLRYHADQFGKPAWYAEPQIMELAKARLETERTKPKRPKRPPSDKQIEARYRPNLKHVAQQRGPGSNSIIGDHIERIILSEIAEKNRN